MYQLILFYYENDDLRHLLLKFSSLEVAKKVAQDSIFIRDYNFYELYGEEEGFICKDERE